MPKKNSDRPKPTWASNTYGIIQETLKGNFNISVQIDLKEIVNPKRVLTKGFEEKWNKDVGDEKCSPKLRIYKTLKKKLEFESYLRIPFPKFRFLIAKFCTSAHDLEIERGRYTKPKTPVTD